VQGSSKCQYSSCPAHGRGGDRPRGGTSPRFDDDRRAVGAAGAAAPGGGEHRRARGQAREVGPAPGPGRDLLPGPRRDRLAGPAGRLPPHQTVYALFRRSTGARAWCRIYAALSERARLADGRGPVPTAAVIDSQTVRTADTVPTTSSGRHRRAAAGRRGHDRLLAGPRRCVPHHRRAARGVLHDHPGVGRRRYAGRFVRDARKIWDLAVAIVKRPTRPRASSCATAAGSWSAPSPG
jgi:hypothetical protein